MHLRTYGLQGRAELVDPGLIGRYEGGGGHEVDAEGGDDGRQVKAQGFDELPEPGGFAVDDLGHQVGGQVAVEYSGTGTTGHRLGDAELARRGRTVDNDVVNPNSVGHADQPVLSPQGGRAEALLGSVIVAARR